MIICVSANPAIDRRMRLDRLHVGAVNRARDVLPRAGGKAAHVAFVARTLGADVQWTGFLGGATGEECERGLETMGIPVHAVLTNSATRMNLEIIEQSGAITEILEPGGGVDREEVEALLSHCDHLFEQHKPAAIVLSGSLPPGAPDDLYARITDLAHRFGHQVFVDSSGRPLLKALASGPDFVKINHHEAAAARRHEESDESGPESRFKSKPGSEKSEFKSEIGSESESESKSGFKLKSKSERKSESESESTLDMLRWLIAQGARSAAISYGKDGLAWMNARGSAALIARPPALSPVSTVGCGDATLAGFVVGTIRKMPPEEIVRLATACGAANCLANSPGIFDAELVEQMKPLVQLHSTKL